MGGLGTTEIIIIAVVILILFGSRKMPDAARSLGRSLRILKAEVKGLHDDDDRPADTQQPPGQLPAGQSATTPATTAPNSPVPGATPGVTGAGTSPTPDRSDAP
jgi:sec-independent protein translocase protein TatA